MTRPRILVLQNSIHAPAGLIGERLDAGGAIQDVRLVLDGETSPAGPEGYDGLVVLGGPMNALDDETYPNLRDEARLVRQFAAAGLPIMGICLGAQIMARAFGAAVRQSPTPEIGFTRIDALPAAGGDPLLEGAVPLPLLMHWHYDTFDLPAGATPLATNAVCANQAFRMGAGQYAFQFHLEVTPEIIRAWIRHFRDQHQGDTALDVEAIERQIGPHMAEAAAFGRLIGDRWLRLVARRLAA